MDKLDLILQKLEQIDKRLEAHDKRFDEHDRRFDEHDKRFDRLEILLEHDIPKQIALLAEGHKAILARLPEADEVSGLRSRIHTLETVVAKHSADIAEIKKAQ